MSRHEYQAGFGTIGILVIALVALALGGIGLAVSNRPSDTNKASTTPATSPDSKNQVTEPKPTPVEPATTEFAIAELGVKFGIPQSLKREELNYVIKDIQLSDGGTAKAAYFSTKQLTKSASKCSADNMSIAAMIIGAGQYPKDSPTVAMDYGPLLKQFPDKFVTFLTSRASCTEGKDEAVQKKSSDTAADLSESVKSVELAN